MTLLRDRGLAFAVARPSEPVAARRGEPEQPRAVLEALARRVDRLSSCWRDPARFFDERDKIRSALEKLARVLPAPERMRVGNARRFTR